MKKQKITKRTRLIICLCMAGIILIGSAFSLLSAMDGRINRFTRGVLSLSLTEENWSEVSAANLVPLQIVNKDPRIINDNEENISAWVFMSVKVPSTDSQYEAETSETVTINSNPELFGADGTGLTVVGSYYDMFRYTVNDGWELVAIDASRRNEENGYTSYYYVYTKGALAGGETTETALFDTVQLVNLMKTPNDDKYKKSIDVEGCGIQQDNIDSVYSAWAIFANQNANIQKTDDYTFIKDGLQLDNNYVKYAS